MSVKPTISVKLDSDDFWFLCESMSANVPCCEDMTPKERKTSDKINEASLRLKRKEIR